MNGTDAPNPGCEHKWKHHFLINYMQQPKKKKKSIYIHICYLLFKTFFYSCNVVWCLSVLLWSWLVNLNVIQESGQWQVGTPPTAQIWIFTSVSSCSLCSVVYLQSCSVQCTIMAFTWIITYLTDAFLFGPLLSYAVSIENEKARIWTQTQWLMDTYWKRQKGKYLLYFFCYC